MPMLTMIFTIIEEKFMSQTLLHILTTADVPEDVTLIVREAAHLHSNTGGQGFSSASAKLLV